MKRIWISLSSNKINLFLRAVSNILLQPEHLMWVQVLFPAWYKNWDLNIFAVQSLQDLDNLSSSHSFFFNRRYDNLVRYLHFWSIWICKSCLNCGPIRVSVIRAGMLAVWELAVQFDGCVCCRILTSSFHDWLDFIEEMMKGATVYTISYIMSSSHTPARPLSILSPSVSILSPPTSWHTFQLMLCQDH